MTDEVLEGKGKVYLADDRSAMGKVLYHLVRRQRTRNLAEWHCERLRFETEESLVPGTKEVILELEDGREVRLLMEHQVRALRLSGRLTSTEHYRYTVLSGLD